MIRQKVPINCDGCGCLLAEVYQGQNNWSFSGNCPRCGKSVTQVHRSVKT